MKVTGLIFMFLLSCNSVSERYTDNDLTLPSSSAQHRNTLIKDQADTKDPTYQVIASTDSTFGYNIYTRGKLFIHQPHKPGSPGIKGFSNRDDAAKVARLVIEKLQRGEVLPSISVEEMKRLDVIE